MLHDVFICHASPDKATFVRPLVKALCEANVEVWYDEKSLKLGDSIRRTIDKGLTKSRFGIVVLSKAFFAGNWPQYELDGLAKACRRIYVQAYRWWLLAAGHGNEVARNNAAKMEFKMTREQIAEGQNLVRNFKPLLPRSGQDKRSPQ